MQGGKGTILSHWIPNLADHRSFIPFIQQVLTSHSSMLALFLVLGTQ